MTVIKITVIHSKGYNQITMGIETLRNIVIITTDIFAVCRGISSREKPAGTKRLLCAKNHHWNPSCSFWSRSYHLIIMSDHHLPLLGAEPVALAIKSRLKPLFSFSSLFSAPQASPARSKALQRLLG